MANECEFRESFRRTGSLAMLAIVFLAFGLVYSAGRRAGLLTAKERLE